MILYSIPIYTSPECVKQLCDGILFYDKNAIIVLHVSKSTSIDLFNYNNEKIIINPTQFETNWGWDFTRIHVSNYIFVKNKYNIEYIIFVTSNCLMLRNPSEFIKDYDSGFSEQQHGFRKLTPPLLVEDYQIGWGGSFLNDPIYLNILSELGTTNKYGCIIDGTYVKSFIMDKICYFYEKYFNYKPIYFYLEEILIPTIACNLSQKISDSLLQLETPDLNKFKIFEKNENIFFNKRIELNISNEIRLYYDNLINKKA